MKTLGWDIGGVNTKAALVDDGHVVDVRVRAYELQRAPGRLAELLREVAQTLGASGDAEHAVTMTAELSQMFRTKRDGVAFVLDAVEAAFAPAPLHVFTTDGRFVSPAAARRLPLLAAASNWVATAQAVAAHHRDALLVDIGTTTTDIIPIVDGRVSAAGWTDPDRLASRELVYAGALRTPVEAIVTAVPFRDGDAMVSAESFALIGDVHVWRGDLAPEEYTWPTPDGRPATRTFAGERLARIVCADGEMLDEAAISRIADAVADAQNVRIADAIRVVCARHPSLRTAVVAGLGAFIAERAARGAGLGVVSLAAELGDAGARSAPASAVALLLDQQRAGTRSDSARVRRDSATPDVDIVVKIGGSLLREANRLAAVLDRIAEAAPRANLLIVPGGGAFADAVREVDAQLGLSDDASHWMAILAMDQYAELIASKIPGGTLVDSATGVRDTLTARRIPVLAPSRWMRASDPLPHTWDVTSDSIAAWIAGATGASRLVLIKPAGASGGALVDPYFSRAVTSTADVTIVAADADEALQLALRGQSSAASIRLSATPR